MYFWKKAWAERIAGRYGMTVAEYRSKDKREGSNLSGKDITKG